MAERISKLERFRSYLAIDRNDLDSCCEKQPELFYHVAEELAQAVASKDATKLKLEELEATTAKRLRQAATDNDEKITEVLLKQRLTIQSDVKALQQELLAAQERVGTWMALRDAFTQRSFMLRELVPMYLARLSSSSVSGARYDIAETNRVRANAERARQRNG